MSEPSKLDHFIRLKRAKAALAERHLKKCQELLDEAGVPEVVSFADDPVPANSAPARLRWFLLRRKDVKRQELNDADIAFIKEMRSMHEPYSL